jgi:hypothetical protein
MRGQCQGVRLTHTTHPTVADTPDKLLEKKNDVLIHIYELNENDQLTGTLYADQTGDFPHLSSHGNRLIVLLHHIDSNSMWVEPLKNQKESTLIAVRTCALERMRRLGIVPKHQILDNQCHGLMKQAIEETTLSDGSILKMTYKLVPPEEHRRNMAKKSIQTFKDHFVGVLSGCAKAMPMHLWCQLLPLVERHLLLLRQSRVNLGMSAYAYVYQGQHNYSKHPFVPIGMGSLVHVKPHKRRTYAQHCEKGFVIGISFKHYWCQKIWMKDTHGMRILGAVWLSTNT